MSDASSADNWESAAAFDASPRIERAAIATAIRAMSHAMDFRGKERRSTKATMQDLGASFRKLYTAAN